MEPLALPRIPLPPADQPQVMVPLPSVTPGQRPSLAAIFAAEESGLLRYALGLVGRRAVAEELVQETFLRLHQVWEQVENPRGWLYRSLRNLALNHLRDRPGESELTEDTPPTEAELPAGPLGRNHAVGMARF